METVLLEFRLTDITKTGQVMKLAYHVSPREHWISAAGALVAITAILSLSLWLDGPNAVFVTMSMGASAVLVFAAPHGAMSQPWPVVGGHVVSALLGVACAMVFADQLIVGASMAVALSLAAMYALRCLHPPGGATALYAVLGGEAVNALGFAYVWNPVLLNAVILLLVAVAFNLPLEWRRYPQALSNAPQAHPHDEPMIPHSNLVYALSELDTFIDISEEDLLRIYALAMQGKPAEEIAALRLAGARKTVTDSQR